MINKYNVEIKGTTQFLSLEVSYKNGNFYSLKRKKGSHTNWVRLMSAIPYKEEGIAGVMARIQQVVFTVIAKKAPSLFTEFQNEFFEFYKEKTDLQYNFRPVDGFALKGIITHIQKHCNTADDALATWQVVLSNWDVQEDFYKKQISLKQINGNLNDILRNIKNGKQDTKKGTANSYADDIRQSI